jgi:acid stress-induced BolA-like protein IbaG/YrbA
MMQAEAIKVKLEQALTECHVEIHGDGHHFYANVVSPIFADKSRVARQQLVYQVLHEQIQSGKLHAISFKTYTPDEWQAQGDV